MIDYGAVLLDPIYLIHGVSAVITPPVGEPFEVAALDKTAGIAVHNANPSGLGYAHGGGEWPAQAASIRPAAVIRMSELSAINVCRSELDGGDLCMNGKRFRIESTLPKPVPNGGEAEGELFLFLIESNDG